MNDREIHEELARELRDQQLKAQLRAEQKDRDDTFWEDIFNQVSFVA